MRAFNELKVHHKLLIPNILNIVLLVAVLFFFLNSRTMITKLSTDQNRADKSINNIQKTSYDINAYMHRDMSYDALNSLHGELLHNINNDKATSRLNTMWSGIKKINDLRSQNNVIVTKINKLLNTSILQSNSYITNMVKKLSAQTAQTAQPAQATQPAKPSQPAVTPLEILVIGGANNNTSFAYQLKVVFARMQKDITQKRSFLALLDHGLTNVNNDIKHLAGTPFQSLAQKSKESLLTVKDLANSYIKNVNSELALRNTIAANINASSKDIQSIQKLTNDRHFTMLRGYFRSMLIMILTVCLLGIAITAWIRRSVGNTLREIIQGLSGASREVNLASGQLSQASQSLAEGATEQAASVEEISASLEEISAMTKGNAKNAGEADSLMQDAKQTFEAANSSMRLLTASMEEISKASEETSKIIKTIDEIAFQTNLLALNAAVEAARAGEAGAGFAVVADEVRNLAMRAAEAAKNTTALIEGTVKKVRDGSGLVTKTSESFGELGDSTAKVATLIVEIATASKEQSLGIDQVSTGMNQTEQVIQKNSANAEQTAAASKEMNAQAEQMKGLVARLVALVGTDRRDASAGTGGVEVKPQVHTAARAKEVHRTALTEAPVNRRANGNGSKIAALEIPFETDGPGDIAGF
ncbi:MAG: methyl-accepting chemotaxis protein [Syntrophobacteraceae bacterium]